jgi:hypothetical protein
MPEGPATGRVEAKRRALNDAEHGASIIGAMVCSSIEVPMVVVFFRRTALVREPIPAEHIGRLLARVNVDAGGAVLLHELGSQTAICGTTNDGVNDPRQGALGSCAGYDSGVVHAIVGAVTSAQALLDEAANSAASWSRARQRTLLQAVACGSCS